MYTSLHTGREANIRPRTRGRPGSRLPYSPRLSERQSHTVVKSPERKPNECADHARERSPEGWQPQPQLSFQQQSSRPTSHSTLLFGRMDSDRYVLIWTVQIERQNTLSGAFHDQLHSGAVHSGASGTFNSLHAQPEPWWTVDPQVLASWLGTEWWVDFNISTLLGSSPHKMTGNISQ